jgi:chemotaxis protein CheD
MYDIRTTATDMFHCAINIINNFVSIGMGEGYVGMAPRIICSKGLGSCVAVAIYDYAACIGGLAHVVLPVYTGKRVDAEYRHADTAVDSILKEMRLLGSDLTKIISKMAGGARIFSSYEDDEMGIGEQNILSIQNILKKKKIPVIGQDVGGTFGRNVEFDLSTGTLRISTIGRVVREL